MNAPKQTPREPKHVRTAREEAAWREEERLYGGTTATTTQPQGTNPIGFPTWIMWDRLARQKYYLGCGWRHEDAPPPPARGLKWVMWDHATKKKYWLGVGWLPENVA